MEVKRLRNGNYKYRGVTFVDAPTDKYGEMVEVIKTTKKMEELNGRKFLTQDFLIKGIEILVSEKLIESGERSVKKEIASVTVTNSFAFKTS